MNQAVSKKNDNSGNSSGYALLKGPHNFQNRVVYCKAKLESKAKAIKNTILHHPQINEL